MARYIVKRLLIALVVLFGITIIDFAIMTMAGNPIQIISGGPKVQKEVLAQKAQNLGLNAPVPVQYVRWLFQVFKGDFGYSYKTYEPVSSMIRTHIGPTLILMGSALLLSLVLAVAGASSARCTSIRAETTRLLQRRFSGRVFRSFLWPWS